MGEYDDIWIIKPPTITSSDCPYVFKGNPFTWGCLHPTIMAECSYDRCPIKETHSSEKENDD